MFTQTIQEFKQHYVVRNLSSTPKLTQKSRNNMPQYRISYRYIVETEFFDRSLRCKTKYISHSKICIKSRDGKC